jgi:hypothetical protein
LSNAIHLPVTYVAPDLANNAIKDGIDMNTIPKRDITGECEGECRNRVREGEQARQAQMKIQRGS